MKLFSLFGGYSVIKIDGNNINRLVNICSTKNIAYTIKNSDKACFIKVHYKDRHILFFYIQKLGMSYTIKKEKGIWFVLARYKIRYWILIFTIIVSMLVWKFSLYIWKIEVKGTNNYTKEQILNYVSTYEVPLGTKRKAIDCKKLERALRLKYNALGWINCYIEGTKLTVEVLETVPQTYATINEVPCNIVAAKDATVRDAIATSGYLLVENGMQVKKGDILITGVMPIYNDYGEKQGTQFLAANGSVYGNVKYDYKDTVFLEQTIEAPKEKKVKYSIFFGGIAINNSKRQENKLIEYKQLKIGKTYYLPIVFCKEKIMEYQANTIELSEEQAKKEATNHLQEYMYRLRKKGVEIIQNNVKIHIVNGRCIASGHFLCKEQIGIAVPIDCSSQGEE